MSTKIITDTSEIFEIDRDDVIQIDDKLYLVRGHERERRFGMEDPKFWVKRVEDLQTGEKKIIKLSLLESFDTYIGGAKIRCFRNPEKEAKILKLVEDHPSFMHGESHKDEKGNILRVLDIVPGENFFMYIAGLSMPHIEYYYSVFPGVLKRLVKVVEAIRFLHLNGFKHGDIRNDHIIVHRDSGQYIWIDFDYDYEATENPYGVDIFGLGNILINALGKGFHTIDLIKQDPDVYHCLEGNITSGDFSILYKRRFINLRK
ncbi:MAG TPA: protein kinase, partial [Desulfobacteraceae bacterium]|nr:protein kinase [Desulfobacteraceae bacterium]